MSEKLDVICIGAAIVDIPLCPVSKNIFEVDSYPLEKIAMTIGGDAINEATIISRLGHKVALMSLVGDDAVGDFVRKTCIQNDVDIKSIYTDGTIDTSINIGLVTDDGERTFVTNRNGSLWKLAIEHIDFSRFSEASLLSLASIFNNPLLNGDALVRIFKEAKKTNTTICADMIKPRLNETLEDIREALSYIDYFFPNYDEACLLTGETETERIADCFLDCGVKNVIIKTGKKGCFIKNSQITKHVPAYPGIKALDTIGAGDNFVAGFITAILDQKPIEACAQFANVTAAISVQSLGATTGVQKRAQVEEWLVKYLEK